MSNLYGSIVGNRGEATRTGSDYFRTSCQSYDGSIITIMEYDSDKNLRVKVGTNESSRSYTDSKSYDFNGSFEEFKELLKLHHQIKTGEVSVVHHRAKSNKMLGLERAFK